MVKHHGTSISQNYDDCLATYKTIIITEKVKVLSQHYSGILFSTIKTLYEHKQEETY